MKIEICNYCNIYLGLYLLNDKPCCQFCAEEQETLNEQEQ
jgi:hypothetical protein